MLRIPALKRLTALATGRTARPPIEISALGTGGAGATGVYPLARVRDVHRARTALANPGNGAGAGGGGLSGSSGESSPIRARRARKNSCNSGVARSLNRTALAPRFLRDALAVRLGLEAPPAFRSGLRLPAGKE